MFEEQLPRFNCRCLQTCSSSCSRHCPEAPESQTPVAYHDSCQQSLRGALQPLQLFVGRLCVPTQHGAVEESSHVSQRFLSRVITVCCVLTECSRTCSSPHFCAFLPHARLSIPRSLCSSMTTVRPLRNVWTPPAATVCSESLAAWCWCPRS